MKWKTLAPNKLDTLIRSQKRIFVLNTSVLPSGDKGMIVVNFYDGTRREFFKMPPTFIPMAISDTIPAARLADSSDFKNCLIKGMLTLVDPDQAEDYLETEDAQVEFENLVLSEHSSKAKGQDLEQKIMKRAKVVHHQSDSMGPMDEEQDVSSVDTVSNKVRALVEGMISGTKEPGQVIVELRRHQTALTAVDLSYVLGNSTDGSLTKWCEKAIGELAKAGTTSGGKVRPVNTVTAAKKAKKDSADFSFDDDDSDLTPEEKAADAAARARALASQDLAGEGTYKKQIDNMLKKK
jgi:hypothetical protein